MLGMQALRGARGTFQDVLFHTTVFAVFCNVVVLYLRFLLFAMFFALCVVHVDAIARVGGFSRDIH